MQLAGKNISAIFPGSEKRLLIYQGRQLCDDKQAPSGQCYTDTFSNRSVFISLRFQIDPLWIEYSDVCVFMIVFIISV